MQELWDQVDQFIESKVVVQDPVLLQILQRSAEAGLPAIWVSPSHAKFLAILVQITGAKRILEIGTLGGYSAVWMARASGEEGKVVTLEIDPKNAEIARENIGMAGLSERIEIRIGPALDTLQRMVEAEPHPFDLVFIDADKKNNPSYFRLALQMTKVGGLIIVDNVVRRGRVVESDTTDPDILGTRKLFDVVAAEPRVVATALQTVGNKGHDGFALIRVVK